MIQRAAMSWKFVIGDKKQHNMRNSLTALTVQNVPNIFYYTYFGVHLMMNYSNIQYKQRFNAAAR